MCKGQSGIDWSKGIQSYAEGLAGMFMQIPAEPSHNTNHLKLDTYKDVKAGNAENTST